MSDTAGGDLTPASESSANANPAVAHGVSLSVAAQIIKALGQSQVPTQAQLLTSRNELLALQDEALASAGKAAAYDVPNVASKLFDNFANLVGKNEADIIAKGAPNADVVAELFGREAANTYVQWKIAARNQDAYLASQYEQARLAKADAKDVAQSVQGDIRDTETAMAEGDSWASALGTAADAVTVVGGVATAAYGLYEYAGGTADTQVSTLQAGTTWNPAGDPQAPSQLANVPSQVISVANEAQLVAAINQVNASPGNYTINLTATIVVTADLPAIAQPTGSVLINGDGNLLYGLNTSTGFVVDGANATIQNLTVEGFVANGGGGGQARRKARRTPS